MTLALNAQAWRSCCRGRRRETFFPARSYDLRYRRGALLLKEYIITIISFSNSEFQRKQAPKRKRLNLIPGLFNSNSRTRFPSTVIAFRLQQKFRLIDDYQQVLLNCIKPVSSQMPYTLEKYRSFIEHVHLHVQSAPSAPKDEWLAEALKCVDGKAESELRRLVELDLRRKLGAFFTPSALARRVVREMLIDLNVDSVIYDSACGAGNLLLSVWDYLTDYRIRPKSEKCLFGTDTELEFIKAARARVELKHMISVIANNYVGVGLSNAIEFGQMDGLENNKYYYHATHVFVNPPFNQQKAPDDINWAKGSVSSAALFLDRIITYVKPSTVITAILPDVLRSGSRYEKWRKRVLSHCKNERVKLLGQFDKHADVDVFAITLRKNDNAVAITRSLQSSTPNTLTLKDKFEICVGTVVDNRDEHKGRRRGYIVSRGLAGWSITRQFSQSRQNEGRSFSGPFVVVKRTSRMGDKSRAVATIINTPNPVYVDNHLIVLVPKNGQILECRRLVENLKDVRTDDWLNEQIRCRHLTVKIVSDIPIWQ